MENLVANKVHTNVDSSAMSDLTNYHQELKSKYENVDPSKVSLNDGAKELITFNGYYSLTNASGAFFTVDTNIHIKEGSSTPIYDLALIISLNGTTSERYAFTGTFIDNQLTQADPVTGLVVDLTFTRGDGSNGISASFTGNITLPGGSPTPVNGTTYNNPIPYDMYIGSYYCVNPLHINPEKEVDTSYLVMKLEKDYTIMYDFGQNNGELSKVDSFTYNLNMYFFSFQNGEQVIKLIMGTAASAGFACNNMMVDGNKVISRSLQTIQFPENHKLKFPNLKSGELAKFSGYYPLPEIAPLAFLSIQGNYETLIGSVDINEIKIGLSLDGVKSQGFYFEEDNMSFVDGTLSIPEYQISITFKREYNAQKGSLVTIAGFIQETPIVAFTPFNPVPLSAFGGVTLTNTKTPADSLKVENDNKMTYNGETYDSITYVPIMYILAAPTKKPTKVLSFGTDGKNGLACIVTDLSLSQNRISSVYSIPNS